MKKLNGTVTLSILEEDNTQRVIFRIIPLCTKEGLIFQGRKASYPDFGSLRIIPDKREQSSFKERMRAMGNLCCVQLYSEGKELTKIRQNRNYDPNQGECNQYAIYSDVICGFDQDAVFEVFQEDESFSSASTETVLIQRGMVLYGPVKRSESIQWESLKPFGNENYLLHTVEAEDGTKRTYYWNPEAIITWRQRKKAMKHGAEPSKAPEKNAAKPVVVPIAAPVEIPAEKPVVAPIETPIENLSEQPEFQTDEQEQLPIGAKLEILDDQLTHDEQLTELNQPVSDQANRLDRSEKPRPVEVQTGTAHFHGTPIVEIPKVKTHDMQKECSMHHVVERQIKEKQSSNAVDKCDRRHVENPIENLKTALQSAWDVPCLHKKLLQVIGENGDLLKELLQSPMMERQARSAYTAAKAEMDEIEAQRIALLVELDKVKANYQSTKEKMLAEITKQKRDEIEKMDQQLQALKTERDTVENTLSMLGNDLQEKTANIIAEIETMRISSNGSDLAISPTTGYTFEPSEIVEIVRSEMNALGFMCNQDCITELLIHLSLFDEVAIMSKTIGIDELYITHVIQALGLGNVTACPGVFGNLTITSMLPESDLRTPTIEVIKSRRTPIKAYGHKSIRLMEEGQICQASYMPIIQVPTLNKQVKQERVINNGKPISLQTLYRFSQSSIPLSINGEAWFDKLSIALEEDGIRFASEISHIMRMFARIASPQLVGGFMEAADAAVMAWVVPVLMNQAVQKAQTMKMIAYLPRSLRTLQSAE